MSRYIAKAEGTISFAVAVPFDATEADLEDRAEDAVRAAITIRCQHRDGCEPPKIDIEYLDIEEVLKCMPRK